MRAHEEGAGAVPTVGVGYVHAHNEQEKGEENGTPIIVTLNSKTKMIMAKSRTTRWGSRRR